MRKFATMLAALRVPDVVEVLNAVPSLEEAAEVLTLMPLAAGDRRLRSADAAPPRRTAGTVAAGIGREDVGAAWRRTSGPPRCAKCAITAGGCCCLC